ncbi:hypothetical protein RFI_07184 [Reticulomyxa filosa]|uniref:Uncharacterized protein n=1 Tax=Reticulomyxa filosa TaxID=46433 RepID=X6NXE7_RETFI|nr:hypothetical protein RFI_07184 [Reticulomyxa filosa]|eukprot:ETO29937.1 hypothetical protein RFI_07184 [Reticulomyxa filosa]
MYITIIITCPYLAKKKSKQTNTLEVIICQIFNEEQKKNDVKVLVLKTLATWKVFFFCKSPFDEEVMIFGRYLSRNRQTPQPTKEAGITANVALPIEAESNPARNTRKDKYRLLVRQLLSFTLTEEKEKELLYCAAKGFDLPLVIGEQFICKTRPFQSPSYHACLEL